MGWSYRHTINGVTYTTGTQFTLNGTVNCYASCDKTNPLYVKNSNTAWYYGRYDASYSKHPYCISTTRPGLPDLFVDATAFPPAVYTITYNLNGGSGKFPAHYKTHGGSTTLHAHVPTKTGYTFAGWGTSPSSEQPTYKEGQAVGGNSNIVLYAIWRGEECILTFDARGGTVNAHELVHHYGQRVKQLFTPTREGYRFIEWRVNSEDGEPLTRHYIMRGSITAVAIWEALEHTVTIVSTKVFEDTHIRTYVVAHGDSLMLIEPVMHIPPFSPEEKYTFKGWNSSDGEYRTCGSNATCTIIVLSDLTLTEDWEKYVPETCVIRFDAHTNGGTGSFPVVVPRGEHLRSHFEDRHLKLPVATRLGSRFIGWYKSPAGLDGPVDLIEYYVYEDITLYARFKKEYTISVATNGAYHAAILAPYNRWHRTENTVYVYDKGEWVPVPTYDPDET